MNVLHVFKDAFPPTYGGVEQHVWDITRSLAGDFQFDVLTSSRSRHRIAEELEGVRFVRTPEFGRIFSTPITPSWWSELRRRSTTVHFHLPLPLAEVMSLAAWPTGPVVASFYADVSRNPGVARAYSPVQQRFLSRVDRIVVSSHVLAETSPALARHQERIVVVPFGVDVDAWAPDARRVTEIRQAHARPIVLFLGRLVHYKGVDVLIEAMGGVDATLLVVGDGPLRPRLERLGRDRSPELLRFVGNVSNEERSAYYRAADVFVLPAVSRAETFGIAMLEAMSFATPVISTEVGTGTSWVNRSGETGLVVPPRDPAALADAITTLLSDDSRRAGLGEAAARRARESFSKKAMVDGLTEIYRGRA